MPPENCKLTLPEIAFEDVNTAFASVPAYVIQPFVFKLFDSKSSINPTILHAGYTHERLSLTLQDEQ